MTDITIDEEYATLLGYTHEELNHYFDGYLKQFALKRKKSITQLVKELAEYHALLQFVLYSIFSLMGIVVSTEVMTSIGRADLVIELPKFIYFIELKYNSSAEKALEQIHKKQYYKKYLYTDKKITLLGINFTQETKTVSLVSQDYQSASS